MSEAALDRLEEVATGEPLIEVEGLSKYFSSESGLLSSFRESPDVEAVDDVDLEIRKGEILALVGESGCGKSTLARTILQLERPTTGSIQFKGLELSAFSNRELRPLRREMQMIFQDPQSSFDPRRTVGRSIEEPMKAHDLHDAETRRERARDLLDQVGLEPNYYDRYPHEFSGGQLQRINLARALSTAPEVILCDEPVSALDVTIQAQVLNTMRELQREFGVTYLFISHDLSMVRFIADRVAVMYLGHIVELAEKEELFENPQHPYTKALLEAIPVPDPRLAGERTRLTGDVPSPINPPSGCRFRTRCPELIQPGEADVDRSELSEEAAEAMLGSYGLTEREWEAVLAFTRGVKRRSFAIEADEPVERTVDAEFFADGRPGGEPGRVVEEAIGLLVDAEWERAATLLSRTFEETSICAARRPDYTVAAEYGEDEHRAACHRHR